MSFDELRDLIGIGDIEKPFRESPDLDQLVEDIDSRTSYNASSEVVIRELLQDDFINSVIPELPTPQAMMRVDDELTRGICGDVLKVTPVIRTNATPRTKTPPDRRTKLRQMLQPLLDLYGVSAEQSQECRDAIETCITSMSSYVERAVKAA